jgi:hypothetical protein
MPDTDLARRIAAKCQARLAGRRACTHGRPAQWESREPPPASKRVAMQAQVLGCLARIEPLILVTHMAARDACHDGRCHAVDKLIEQLVNERAARDPARPGAIRERIPSRLPGFRTKQASRLLALV